MTTPLKIERMKSGLSGEELALRVGATQSYIAKLENGKSRPGLALAKRIANFFDGSLTRDQILFPEDYPEPAEKAR